MPDALRSLAHTVTPGQPLGTAALIALAEAIPGAIDLSQRVRHEPGTRYYDRLLDLPDLDVWLICWMHDNDTGFHDHDRSAGAVHIVAGTLAEDQLVLDAPGASTTTIHATGTTFAFEEGHIHRMHHVGSEPAVSIHAYSPKIDRMGAYVFGPGGEVRRLSIPGEAELRPLAAEIAI
jgi:hypothetical protein